ncbi:uncharacterized protein [Henckelia pumila]|uniref:uncharacterized protein n=1 Tax=Henckelia pumila TaxID=405737 RepID=UPI003C6E635A
MKRIFLEKYFPASRTSNMRKEIYGIKQYTGESLHEYWERNMLDAASGGVFVDKTSVQARNLIENMAANSQQFGINMSDPAPKRGNGVNVSSLEQQLIELTNFVHQMAVGSGQTVRACGVYAKVGHATDMCPTLQEGSADQVNAAEGFPGPPQQKYDPYSNTYNPGWKDNPNLRYGNPSVHQPHNQAYRAPYHPPPQRSQIPEPGEFLEKIVKDLATNTLNFQQETRTSIQELNTQMGQLATAVNSGKKLKVSEEVVKKPVKNEHEEKSEVEEEEIVQKEAPSGKFPSLSKYKPIPPFPLALKESRKDEGIKGMYEIFRRCEVNISLLDVIKQIPRYAKFLKELCTVKRKHKLKGCSLYASLNLGPLNKTEIVIQMADRSTIYPRGLLEDVLVQVDNLVFPADFYVLDMKSNNLNSTIFLGRPFLKTSKSIIDVNNVTLTMEFDREVVKFHIFYTLQIPDCESVVNNLDVINHLSQEHKKFVNGDKVKEVIARPIENFTVESFHSDLQVPRKSK